MCFGMCEVISMQIIPAGERPVDLCLPIWLLQEVTGFKGLQYLYNVHKARWYCFGVQVTSSAWTCVTEALQLQDFEFLKAVVFDSSDCCFGTFSQCYFLPWTSSRYLVWRGSKVTWSNLFPSLMLTEKWRMITSFVSSVTVFPEAPSKDEPTVSVAKWLAFLWFSTILVFFM